ncbi:alkyl sulfatase C-terminal domain-containing protein [Streptomyces sp. NPDC055632]
MARGPAPGAPPQGDLRTTVQPLSGHGTENGPWHNLHLSGAAELRDGRFGTPTQTNAPDVIARLSAEMLFDAPAIQVDGPRAWNERLTVDVVLTPIGGRHRLQLADGVLPHSSAVRRGAADATTTTRTAALPALAEGVLIAPQPAAAGIELEGEATVLDRLAALPDADFVVVTP